MKRAGYSFLLTNHEPMLNVFWSTFLSLVFILSTYSQEESEDVSVNTQYWFDFNGKMEFS